MTCESTSKQNPPAYVCDQCSVGFATRHKLSRHIDYHHEGESFATIGRKTTREEWLAGNADVSHESATNQSATNQNHE